MFENKASDPSTSPPSRGRSPNPSELSNNSRPVSKVRASFVAIEKPGVNGGAPILGIRRTSEVSSLGEIKENPLVDSAHPDNQSVVDDMPPAEERSSDAGKMPGLEKGGIAGGLGSILKGSAFVETTTSQESTNDTPNTTKLHKAPAQGEVKKTLPLTPSKPTTGSKAAAPPAEKTQATHAKKPEPLHATTLHTTKATQPAKAPPARQSVAKLITSKSPTVSKPAPKTPTSPLANLKGGPAKIKGVMESAKQAQHARDAVKQHPPKTDKVPASGSRLEPPAKSKQSSDSTKKEQPPTSPKAARPPKATNPKPPGKATLPTATSAAKHDTHLSPTDSEFRKPVAKRPSTVSMRQPRTSVSSTTSTLVKKPSRVSLANGREQSLSRTSMSRPDDGFLARMMRPTASSAQKMHEKVPANSPPRQKSASTDKPKGAVKHQAPLKTRLEAHRPQGGENKENGGDHEQIVSPEVAAPLPPQATQDSIKTVTETEPSPSEPTQAREQAQT